MIKPLNRRALVGATLASPFLVACASPQAGPQGASHDNEAIVRRAYHAAEGNVFDVRCTPSYTGILTEFARRQRRAAVPERGPE